MCSTPCVGHPSWVPLYAYWQLRVCCCAADHHPNAIAAVLLITGPTMAVSCKAFWSCTFPAFCWAQGLWRSHLIRSRLYPYRLLWTLVGVQIISLMTIIVKTGWCSLHLVWNWDCLARLPLLPITKDSGDDCRSILWRSDVCGYSLKFMNFWLKCVSYIKCFCYIIGLVMIVVLLCL
jgi:hypothetical protein